MGGGSGGKGKGGTSPSTGERMASEIARREYSQTDPLRQIMLGQFGNLFGYQMNPQTSGSVLSPTNTYDRRILRGDESALPSSQPNWTYTGNTFDPRSIPGYDAIYRANLEAANQGYEQAKEAILGGTPRGGAQVQALADLEYGSAMERSRVGSSLTASFIEDLLNKAYGYAMGSPQTSLSGMGISANAAAARQQADLQSQAANNAMKGQLGMGAGLMIASGGKAAPAVAGAGATAVPAASIVPPPMIF